jgi:predicted nucleic acid-binding protein
MSIVVSDTSPIRALAHLQLTRILRDLYSTVIIPTAVAGEIKSAQAAGRLGEPLPDWIEIRSPKDTAKVAQLLEELDPGESEAIALAVEIRADYLLMDEWGGREVAAGLGLTRIGLLGVLLQAKKEGMIPAIKYLVDRLRREINFRVSDALYAKVMADAGE